MPRVERTGQPGTPAHQVAFYPPKNRLVALALGAVAFVIVCAIILGIAVAAPEQLGGFPRSTLAVIAAPVGLVFFGFCAYYSIRRLAWRRPALVLDSTGIYDNGSALAAGQLRWPEVQWVAPVSFMSQTFLGIEVADRETVLARLPRTKQKILRINIGMGMPTITVPAKLLALPVAAVCAEIEWLHPLGQVPPANG